MLGDKDLREKAVNGIVAQAFVYAPRANLWMQPYVVAYDEFRWWADPRILAESSDLRNPDRARDWAHSAMSFCGFGVLSLAFLAQMPHYLVSRREPVVRDPRAKHHREKDAKPWTTTGLKTILLIKPGESPRPATSAGTGTHASPTPGPRRGGWMVLKHPRYYEWPHNERLVEGAPSYDAPPLKEVFYDSGEIVSGADDQLEIRVYRNVHGAWREVHVRRVYRKATWVGPKTDYLADDGQVYKVLLRESDVMKGVENAQAKTDRSA